MADYPAGWAVERAGAIREIAIRHEADCGTPGVFASVKDTGRAWVVVIEHYDPERPLERIGKPCAYTARHVWNVDRTA
jgi:hypothetical protein